MMRSSEKMRVARQLELEIEVNVEVIGRPSQQLSPAPTALPTDEVVEIPSQMLGKRFRGVLSNLTPTGAAVGTDTILPLMSRVALTFQLEGGISATALGIVMWRRTEEVMVPREGLPPLKLKPGFGVLFEALPDDTRAAISDLIAKRGV